MFEYNEQSDVKESRCRYLFRIGRKGAAGAQELTFWSSKVRQEAVTVQNLYDIKALVTT